jgi:hypothetical protein
MPVWHRWSETAERRPLGGVATPGREAAPQVHGNVRMTRDLTVSLPSTVMEAISG